MFEKKPQCVKCKHFMRNSSCGSCAIINQNTIEKISQNLDIELIANELDSYKQSCKIIMRYPEEFANINVFKCKYYMPSAFCFG